MARTDFTSVDEYLAAQPAAARSVLERVRATIRKALPGAAEGLSYQMPVYRVDGAMVLYFAGYQRHYSLYPASERVLAELEDEVADRVHSKATLRFSYDEVPVRLITRIAKLRAAEVAEGRKAKPAPSRGSKKKSRRTTKR